MDIKSEIQNVSQEFEPIFQKEIVFVLNEQKNYSTLEIDIDEYIKNVIQKYSAGGKRIRPFIVNSISQKGFAHAELLNTALAIEMFHLAALIHDDIIDNADKRRNEETIHHALEKHVKNKKDLGRDIAILVGDAFLTHSYRLITHTQNDALIKSFFEMAMRTIRGQYIDVVGANEDYGNVTKDAVHTRHMLKTAWYTFGSPAYMGLILSEKKYTQNEIDIIIKTALEIGLLYQIRDDIHDCTNEKSGKKLFGDIFEGQTTWVTLFLKEHYTDIFEESKAFAKLPQTDENIHKLKALYQNIQFQEPYANEMQKVIQKIDEMPSELDTVKQKFHAILTLFGL
jgi:geranylgeranyl pyrophosphate synthase